MKEIVSPQVENLATSCVVNGAAWMGDDPDIMRRGPGDDSNADFGETLRHVIVFGIVDAFKFDFAVF